MVLEEKLKNYQENIKQNPLTSATIFIAVLLLLLIVVPYADISLRGINNSTVQATLENQSRATLVQLLGGLIGGIVVLYGIYMTIKTIQMSNEGQTIVLENMMANYENAQANIMVSVETQNTSNFTRAIDQLGANDQLGNPAIEIRLGGIYALEKIANKSDEYYWPIMEILTAYVRKNSSRYDIGDRKDVRKQIEVSFDVQAILSVINSSHNGKSKCLDLCGTWLEWADLKEAHLEGAHLEGADLGRAILEGAHLKGAKLTSTILINANLCETHLEGAYLQDANLGFANLKGAHLKGAYFEDASFIDVRLEKVDLEDAHLKGAKNLTVDQLSQVKTLYNAELDEGLEAELRAKGFGHLLDDEPDNE